MVKLDEVKEELRSGTLPKSGIDILNSLEEDGRSISQLGENLEYTNSHIGRFIHFYQAQGIIEYVGTEEPENGGQSHKIYNVKEKFKS